MQAEKKTPSVGVVSVTFWEGNSDFPRATERVSQIPSMAFWLNSYHFHLLIQKTPTSANATPMHSANFYRPVFMSKSYLLKGNY